MTSLANTMIKFGKFGPFNFEPIGTHGDWLTGDPLGFETINFLSPFPPTLADGSPSKGKIRVIVTPEFNAPAGSSDGLAVVPIVIDAIETGFDFNARNADPQKSAASFFYIAVLEGVATQPPVPPVNVRFGILQPHALQKGTDPGSPGDRASCWTRWPSILFSSPLMPNRAVVLTAHNLYIDGDHGSLHNAAAVGNVMAYSSDFLSPGAGIRNDLGFGVHARSIDHEGQCGFYYVAVDALPPGGFVGNINIDSGTEADTDEDKEGAPLIPAGNTGDWHFFDIYFKQPFLTPPVVLGISRNGAVVTVAQNVTTYGFTMATRNSDTAASFAQFTWVAFGCGIGCG